MGDPRTTCKFISLGLIFVMSHLLVQGLVLPTETEADTNKNFASFTKKEDGTDLLAVASSQATAAASASVDTDREDRDRDEDQRDVGQRRKTAQISQDRPEPVRTVTGQEKDRDRLASPKKNRVDLDRERDRDRDLDRDNDRDRQPGRVRGKGNRDRYSDEDGDFSHHHDDDNDEADERGRRRGYYDGDDRRSDRDRCRRCEDYDDDGDEATHHRRRGPTSFNSVFEPMFDMIRRMPGYNSDLQKSMYQLMRASSEGGLVAASSASSFGGDGLSRSTGTTINNGRVRGYVSETGRDGRTRTRYINEDEED